MKLISITQAGLISILLALSSSDATAADHKHARQMQEIIAIRKARYEAVRAKEAADAKAAAEAAAPRLAKRQRVAAPPTPKVSTVDDVSDSVRVPDTTYESTLIEPASHSDLADLLAGSYATRHTAPRQKEDDDATLAATLAASEQEIFSCSNCHDDATFAEAISLGCSHDVRLCEACVIKMCSDAGLACPKCQAHRTDDNSGNGGGGSGAGGLLNYLGLRN